jgi:hypothetical protein
MSTLESRYPADESVPSGAVPEDSRLAGPSTPSAGGVLAPPDRSPSSPDEPAIDRRVPSRPSTPPEDRRVAGSRSRSGVGPLDVARWWASGPWALGPAAERWARRLAAALAVLVAVVVVSPIVVTFANLWGDTWYPAGDQALIELRTADVGKAATPLLGPYSRFGWNHPGPLEFYVLAPLYRAAGSASMGLLLATVGALWVAWRRGRLALVVGLGLVLSLLLRSMGPTDLSDPWNPYLTVVPFALFLLLVWAVLDGDLWMLPLVALTGSFLVQTHVGFALQVGVGAVVALLGVWRARRVSRLALVSHRGADQAAVAFGARRPWLPISPVGSETGEWPTLRSLRSVLVVTAVVMVVTWLPVAVDQLAGRHNATEVASFFLDSSRPTIGREVAAGLVARQVGAEGPLSDDDAARAPWSGGPEPIDRHGGEVLGTDLTRLLWPMGLFIGSLGLALVVGPRGRSAVRLAAVTLTAAVFGAAATARISDQPYNYLLRWWWVIGALLWLSIGWSSWCAAGWRWGRSLRWLAVLVVVPALWTATATTLEAAGQPNVPMADLQPAIGALAGPVTAATPPGSPVEVRGVGSHHNIVGDGLMLQLIRSGRRVVVDPATAFKFGEDNVATSGPEAVVFVVSNDSIERYRQRDDVREIVSYDPLTAEERARFIEIAASLRAQFEAAGRPDLVTMIGIGDSLIDAHGLAGVDQELLEQAEELRRKGMPVAAFVGDRAALERDPG